MKLQKRVFPSVNFKLVEHEISFSFDLALIVKKEKPRRKKSFSDFAEFPKILLRFKQPDSSINIHDKLL